MQLNSGGTRESIKDDSQSRCPSTATTQENFAIYQMMMDDRILTVNHIAKVMSIFCEQVESILHKKLGMSKVQAQ